MSDNIISMIEFAVIYSSIAERLQRLESLAINDDDVKLKGEIISSKSALKKVETLYLSTGGNLDDLLK